MTIPVFKYEPRMFMGEVVPEDATHYILDESGVVFVMKHPICGLCIYFDLARCPCWTPIRHTKYARLTGRMCEIKQLPTEQQPKAEHMKSKQEKIMNKQDLLSGMVLTFKTGHRAVVLLGYGEANVNAICYFGKHLGWDKVDSVLSCDLEHNTYGDLVCVSWCHQSSVLKIKDGFCEGDIWNPIIWKREEKSPEQIAYEQLKAQIADEEARHNESMKALREQAEKFKPKG